jgi:hypothetical protein
MSCYNRHVARRILLPKMVAQPFKLEQTTDTGAKPTGGDALNAYRMSSPTPDATAGNPKPNVVEGNQLVISPIGATGTTDATAATQPAAGTKTAFADTSASITNPPADTTAASTTTPTDTTAASATTPAAQTNPMLAAITDQGALPNPGQAVPLWMRLADPTLQPLIQQTYGVSSLNGFQSGAPVSDTTDDTDAIAMPMGHTAPHTSAPSTSSSSG